MVKPQGKARGRPSKYKQEYAEQSRKLYLLGLTDKEVAEFFEVHVDTLFEWRKQHPEFSDANARGKVLADADVAAKLFERALGYSHPAIKIVTLPGGVIEKVPYIEHYPPDTTAAVKWLFNRQPTRWREKVAEGQNQGADELAAEIRELIRAAEATNGGPE